MPNYSTSKPKMLLHACCATCAAYPILSLKDNFNLTLFYYNPNIFPEEEYEKRLADVRTLTEMSHIPLITGKYQNKEWFNHTSHLAAEPEGGKRCTLCFRIRLEKTAGTAKEKGFDIFGTTLSISPHKDNRTIDKLGTSLAEQFGIDFYNVDLKKKDGFKKTTRLSRKFSFYRQNYCGCRYSIKPG